MVKLIERAGPALEVLDFGCGEGPLIHYLLEPRGYKVNLYDHFFYPDRSVLQAKYDFVAAVEVVEHFYDPAREFELLKSLLKPKGRLGIMTEQCSEDTDFSTWHYRRDPTHVAFYSEASLRWVARRYAFNEVIFHSNRLVELL
jgi:2-polyprenyl-3-methyl-5-hydroxy-6-metoxy-1,4-benzoquinol methylase